MQKSYYEVLGATKEVSNEELKKKYRDLCLKYHPDKNPNNPEAEARFKEISEAYSILGNEDKRKKYDHGGNDFGGFPNGFGGDFNMDDIFGGRYKKQSHQQKGSDLRIRITISLYEIFSGVTKKIRYNKEVTCNTCNGTGAADSSSIQTCSTCGGSGWIRKIKNTIIGQVTSQDMCPDCGGSGKKIHTVCSTCSGKKYIFKEETFDLTIPRSVKHGDILSVTGAGNASKNGGANGNLLVLIEEEPNVYFVRQESNIIVSKTISICDAIFGEELEVDAIDGKIRIAVSPGIQSGTRLRVEGKGMYKMNTNYRGDMYIDIKVFTPTSLSESEKETFMNLKDSESIKPKNK